MRRVVLLLALLALIAAPVGAVQEDPANATSTTNSSTTQRVEGDLGNGVTVVSTERADGELRITLRSDTPGTVVWWLDVAGIVEVSDRHDGPVALQKERFVRRTTLDSGETTIAIDLPVVEGRMLFSVWTADGGEVLIPVEGVEPDTGPLVSVYETDVFLALGIGGPTGAAVVWALFRLLKPYLTMEGRMV